MTKLSKLLLASMLLFFSLGFVSCGSDDDDASEGLASHLVGTYEGTVTSIDETANVKMKVTATGDNTVKIEFVGEYPSQFPASIASGLRVADENSIIGTAPLVVNLIYFKNEKNLTCQNMQGEKFSFQGYKK